MAKTEKVQFRGDKLMFVLLVAAMILNTVAAATYVGPLPLVNVYTAVNAALGVTLGMRLVETRARRAMFHQAQAVAAEVETTLAFHDLDHA